MSSRLREYVAVKTASTPGAISAYEDRIVTDRNWARLAGHYSGMLDEMIDAFGGPEKVYAFLCAREDCMADHRRERVGRAK